MELATGKTRQLEKCTEQVGLYVVCSPAVSFLPADKEEEEACQELKGLLLRLPLAALGWVLDNERAQ